MYASARLGLSSSLRRAVAWLVAVMTLGLSTGAFQFADGGCSHDEVHEALSHEHAGEAAPADAHADAGRDASSHEDACPPFCGDCQDCAGCFHPVAIAAVLAAVSAPSLFALEVVPAPSVASRPPSWSPPSLLHVPRA